MPNQVLSDEDYKIVMVEDEFSFDFVELQHLAIPAEFAEFFQGIPRDLFEVDLSSTRLRENI